MEPEPISPNDTQTMSQALSVLWESNGLFPALIENLPGGAMFVVDRDLRYLIAEGEALIGVGFKPEMFVGKTIFEVLPPELATYYEGYYRRALMGERFEHEHTAHGRCFISRGTPLRSPNGDVYAVLAVSYDITDRKRVEDERQQAEAAISADLRATQLLQDLSARLVTEANIQVLYDEILAAAIALVHADAGTLQVLDEAKQDLLFITIKGVDPSLAEHFCRVDANSNTSCGIALATGQRAFVDFDVPETEDPDNSLRLHVQEGFLSAQSTPLITRSGKAIGMVSTYWRKHYRPSDSSELGGANRELRFLDLLARQAADLIEQRQIEQSLRESEAKYRSLFSSMAEGFHIIELIDDEAGEVTDYRFLEGNPAFERLTSLKNAAGKLGSEIAPKTESYWIEAYSRVARTGEPLRIENYNEDTKRWYSAYASRVGGVGSRRVAIIFDDISDRKQAEEAVRQSEERQSFLLKLSDALRSLADPVEIQETVTRTAMNYFGADRCYYCEIENGDAIIRRDAVRGELPSVAGVYPLSSFAILQAVIDAGRPFVVQDVHTTDTVDEDLRQLCIQLQVISYINVPVIKNGKSVGTLCLVQSTPRDWTDLEVELAVETAERTWAAVERARAEIGLRRAAEMDAFRVKLSDALRSLSDAVEIQATVTRITMNFFGADRCYYCEIIDGSAIIRRDASQADLPSVVGAYPLENSPIFRAMLDAGQPFVFQDVHTTNVLDENLRQTCLQLQIIAGINVPVIKQGEPVGILAITQTTPRNWTQFEMDLAEEIADRAWATIERTRAEAALREAELQRFREQSAREQERQRAETLAELDRAKTLFFSNISHEFRTPLTLLLAPLQDALRSLDEWMSEESFEFLGISSLLEDTPLTQNPKLKLQNSISIVKHNLQLAHHNALRLLKLVNTLLDFSRIEAGRIEAVYEPTDLAQLTTELASMFRSAIERAGLRLIVDCPPLPELVYIDREMWEKIILNLLSNALKFTFEGEITVSLRESFEFSVLSSELGEDGLTQNSKFKIQNSKLSSELREDGLTQNSKFKIQNSKFAILQIRDTGTGIAPEHLPHLFERFYQVRGVQARTHEGSGIGLALVHELVQLQGGAIAVSSIVGEGTCFTIMLPFGTAHLPPERVQSTRALTSTAMGAFPYVEEAERWLPAESGELSVMSYALESNSAPQNSNSKLQTSQTEFSVLNSQLNFEPPIQNSELQTQNFHVLIVDDNADMRQYLTRILSEHVHVEAVADGTAALATIQTHPPDLVLSDVMMPRLDGFGLLQTLRADPHTREIPVILLSARAGEEAIAEGLEAGADDYLIKPFSAQELISRVNAHLQMSHLRGEALHEAKTTIRRKDELLSVVSHELNTPLVSMLGWTRLLRVNPSNPAMLSKALDAIEHSATMQAKLVQDLLDVSRITAGKLQLHLQPIELESVIETAIATVTQIAAEKAIHLTWTETTAAVVMGDRERLQQVVCNLLTNAIKFTLEGGRVEVKLESCEFSVLSSELEDSTQNSELKTRNSQRYAQITVTDTGIGIAADFLPHVFEPFRQAGEKNSAKGLGLGLAIAHHIVELHNGTIHAQSAGEGQGATFMVRLPLLEPDS